MDTEQRVQRGQRGRKRVRGSFEGLSSLYRSRRQPGRMQICERTRRRDEHRDDRVFRSGAAVPPREWGGFCRSQNRSFTAGLWTRRGAAAARSKPCRMNFPMMESAWKTNMPHHWAAALMTLSDWEIESLSATLKAYGFGFADRCQMLAETKKAQRRNAQEPFAACWSIRNYRIR